MNDKIDISSLVHIRFPVVASIKTNETLERIVFADCTLQYGVYSLFFEQIFQLQRQRSDIPAEKDIFT